MDTPKVPIQFEIYDGDRLVRTEVLAEPTIKIGKLSSSHLRIDDDDVSRMHAVIEVGSADDVVVLDLGSTKGTLVNGQPVTKQRLRSGDALTLGRHRIVVTISGQSAASARPDVNAMATAIVRPQEVARRAPTFEEDESDSDGGRALEVVAMFGDAVVDISHLREQGTYTIGQANEVNHFVRGDLVPEDPYPLASTNGADMVVNVPESVQGDVMLDGQVYSLDELKAAGKLGKSSSVTRSHALRLPPKARARLHFGGATFLVNHVAAVRPLPPVGIFSSFDGHFGRYFLAAAALHALFAAIILSVPEDAERLELDAFDVQERYVEFMLKPETEKEDKIEDLFKGLKEDEGEAAAKARDEEGKMGKKDSDQKNQRFAIKGPPDTEKIQLAKERAKMEALNTANAAFNQLEGELSAVWGTQERALGEDAVSALGNMFGDRTGEAAGYGGLGVAGAGRGGGGFSDSSIGVGNIGTMGRGGGEGGSGYGRGVSRYGERSGKIPQVIPGKPIVSGALDMETIRRIIRQHAAEYKYCYEKQLNVKRDLAGKVTVKFTISGNGSVIAAVIEESTMGDRDVESCLVDKIKRWVFPEPKGGGIVTVKYPFVFKASN
ncbi:TonB family protein [Myxococcota bacterium]|nr:TonB family protein [Myxococcota bacterium]